MKTLRRAITAVAIASTLVAVAGCSSTNSSGGAATGPGEITPIGYSALFLQDPAQAVQVQTFERETMERGLETLSPTSANSSAATQDSDIRNAVTAGARSIMVIPADPSAIVQSLDFARDKGVKAVSLMLGPEGNSVDISMEFDNYAIGEQTCEYLVDKVGPTGTLLHIQGDMRQVTAREREAGFKDCLTDNYPDVTLIIKPGGEWDPVTAAASVSAALISDPEIGGIFLSTDGYVDAVAQTLASAGRGAPAGDPGHIWMVSIDGTPAALDAIRAGKLDATGSMPMTDFVTYGLDYLEALGRGDDIPLGPTDHGSEIITSDYGYLVDLFPATFVTVDNVDDPNNWANEANG